MQQQRTVQIQHFNNFLWIPRARYRLSVP